MFEILLFSVIFITISFIMNEMSLFYIHGWFIKEDISEIILSINDEDIYINRFNNNILMFKNQNFYVAHHGLIPGILSYYHISDPSEDKEIGRIPTWSPAHKIIKTIFKRKING